MGSWVVVSMPVNSHIHSSLPKRKSINIDFKNLQITKQNGAYWSLPFHVPTQHAISTVSQRGASWEHQGYHADSYLQGYRTISSHSGNIFCPKYGGRSWLMSGVTDPKKISKTARSSQFHDACEYEPAILERGRCRQETWESAARLVYTVRPASESRPQGERRKKEGLVTVGKIFFSTDKIYQERVILRSSRITLLSLFTNQSSRQHLGNEQKNATLGIMLVIDQNTGWGEKKL